MNLWGAGLLAGRGCQLPAFGNCRTRDSGKMLVMDECCHPGPPRFTSNLPPDDKAPAVSILFTEEGKYILDESN